MLFFIALAVLYLLIPGALVCMEVTIRRFVGNRIERRYCRICALIWTITFSAWLAAVTLPLRVGVHTFWLCWHGFLLYCKLLCVYVIWRLASTQVAKVWQAIRQEMQTSTSPE